MKKNLWIWAIAALSMAACTSEDVPTTEQIVTENDWISPDGQVLVQLSAEGLPTPTASVSRAPITGTDIKVLDNLGVFALARGGNYTVTNTPTTPPVLLDNIWAKGQESTTLDDQIHTDENGNPLKRISLYAEKDATNASIYYYPISAANNYDFYGYYPYQVSSKVTKSASDVTVSFDLSDGDIDLITGKAEPAPQIADNKLYIEVKDGAPVVGDATKTWDGYNARYIRKIKYSNELVGQYEQAATENQINTLRYVPNIKFGHRTTQLRFYIVANDKQATVDKEATTKLLVDGVKLLNMQTNATWNLISDEISWGTATDSIEMQKLNEENALLWDNSKIIPAATINDTIQAGYLMVKPQESYTLKLTVHAPQVNEGSAVPQKQDTQVTIQMKDNQGTVTPFVEGKYYNIFIQLNALQEINISAELVDWQRGDDVFVPVGEDD